jgi:hypothetical protein
MPQLPPGDCGFFRYLPANHPGLPVSNILKADLNCSTVLAEDAVCILFFNLLPS